MSGSELEECIIYTRISDAGQTGLGSQEHRCRQHAVQNNWIVAKTFFDEITGGGDFRKRKGLMEMIAFLEANKDKRYILIFDDLKRFARDAKFHLFLRDELTEKYEVRLECLNFPMLNTPEGRYTETIVAAGGELERVQMARQSRQKTIARMEGNNWAMKAPVGYTMYKQRKSMPGTLIKNEPIFSYLKEAFEGFASGRYQTITEVARYLDTCPEFPKGGNGKVHIQRVKDIFVRNVYAGIIQSPGFGISPRKGNHEPMISMETFEKVQERLKRKVKQAPIKKNYAEDFPLRGAVCCSACERPLTSAWSKGRSKKYAYYECQTKGCELRRKSIKKEVIEAEFEALLTEIEPSQEILDIAHDYLKIWWDYLLQNQECKRQAFEDRLKKMGKEINTLINRAVNSESEHAAKAYERRINELELEKVMTTEKLENIGKPMNSFEKTSRTAFTFLRKPFVLWDSGRYDYRRVLLRLVFSAPLIYDMKMGYRTAPIAQPFRLLRAMTMGKYEMVPERGLEPPTPTLRM